MHHRKEIQEMDLSDDDTVPAAGQIARQQPWPDC
jgi:hypothetical protein